VRSEPLPGLSAIVRELAGANDIDSALEIATDAAVALFDADHASIRLCSGEEHLRSVARSGVGSDRPPPSFVKGQGVLGWTAMTGEVARIGDTSTDPRFRATPGRGFDVRSVMSIPLVDGTRVLGVLSMSKAERDAFADTHEHMGVVLAHCLGQMLRAAELEQLATTDSLTRAFNRSYLLPCLSAEMNRSRRSGTTFSVLSMDLDRFKDVNDRFGHTVGDALLRLFTEIVRGCVRDIDMLIRRGGEEFVLVMPETTADEAWVVAERLRSFLHKHPLRVGPNLALHQTASIGVAAWDGTESPSDLDDRADRAMYDAKQHGRNRVMVAPKLALLAN
jgi:two-component system, cell cycle response regulator